MLHTQFNSSVVAKLVFMLPRIILKIFLSTTFWWIAFYLLPLSDRELRKMAENLELGLKKHTKVLQLFLSTQVLSVLCMCLLVWSFPSFCFRIKTKVLLWLKTANSLILIFFYCLTALHNRQFFSDKMEAEKGTERGCALVTEPR